MCALSCRSNVLCARKLVKGLLDDEEENGVAIWEVVVAMAYVCVGRGWGRKILIGSL